HILDYIAVSEDYAVYEIDPPAAWLGKSLAELKVRRRCNINVIAVKENGKLNLCIDPDAPIAEGQTMLVIACEQDILSSLV
ncbi:MAG: TrkA C-terminal domain-containing protein, partial [Pyramidobacter sp.]|nr:TrkA C-terminal domain-containing protein [Pyramidobacter sp.]